MKVNNVNAAHFRIGTALLAAALITGGLFVLAVPASAETSVSVLCYHAFLNKKKKDQFCFTIEELDSQIQQIKKEGFTFVSVYDVLDGKITGNKNVLVTVDDGNKSVYEAYMKVFRPNGIRPLLAIYPNVIGRQHYALTWEQLGRLAGMGCDIAAHGFFHLKINQKLHDKNLRYFNKEIYDSKKVLEEKLGKKITLFVYPFGLRSDITIRTLKEAGYRYAFTIDNGRLDLPVSSMKNVFELPRYMVTRTSWKYCFNRVMKNGRGGSGVTIARTDEQRRGRPDASSLYHERHDSAAGLRNGFLENTGKVMVRRAVSDMDNSAPLKETRHAKKKQENRDGITPLVSENQKSGVKKPSHRKEEVSKTKGRKAKEDHKHLSLNDDRAPAVASGPGPYFAMPIQPVSSGVRPEALALDISGNGFTDDPISRHAERGSETLQSADSGTVNQGKLDLLSKVKGGRKATAGFYSKIKGTYYTLTDETYRTYNDFFGMIRVKVDRFKHTVRGYIIRNF